jgi:hypothetical protein
MEFLMTDIAQHTAGPWKARQDGESFYHEVFDATGIRVCNLLDLRPVHENHANALLIAAAPVLLEALDYLLTQTVDQDLKYGIGLTEGEEDARKQALAAITKAKGGAQ